MSREYVLRPFRSQSELQIDYARELNPQQYAAATAPPGPALVIAGAGAGKTRTLVYRVAFLLEQGIPADRLLLLTFTNKAAREMMRRVAELLGRDLPELWGGTFHAVGHRLLRRHAETVGYRPDFTILDRDDTKHLLQACLAEEDIDPKATRFPKAEVLAEIYSLGINTGLDLPRLLAEHFPYFVALTEPIAAVHRRYDQRKRTDNVLDFDDLLTLWLELLSQHPDLLDRYQRQFQFVLVDEFQDTNRLQCELVDLLAARHHHLMVVGDDAQSIYSWRGANYQNILEFPRRYPEAALFKIETNYRSTPEILAVANAVLEHNTRRFAKNLLPQRPTGIKPALVALHTAQDQASFVAQRVLELRDEGIALNHMAVLYRSHFHAMELQMELTRRNIPFSITSGLRFFEQAHIKDLAAHLKLLSNPRDELAFKRIVQMLPGIGGKGAAKLWTRFSTPPAPVAQPPAAAATPAIPATPLAQQFADCAPVVPRKALGAWTQLGETFAQLEAQAAEVQTADLIELVREALYDEYLQATYANSRSRLEDLDQLQQFSTTFASLGEFLAQLSLLSNLEAEDEKMLAPPEEQIRLSTIHQAKGLEFDVVFLIMLCEGMFPTKYSLDHPEKLEEERRLFHVGITRARNELYLSYPLLRLTAGQGGDYLQRPSRFLDEIPAALLEAWNVSPDPWGSQSEQDAPY